MLRMLRMLRPQIRYNTQTVSFVAICMNGAHRHLPSVDSAIDVTRNIIILICLLWLTLPACQAPLQQCEQLRIVMQSLQESYY